MVFLDLLFLVGEQVGLVVLRRFELIDVFCGAFHGSGSQVLLVGLFEGHRGGFWGDEHVTPLAILLHHAP